MELICQFQGGVLEQKAGLGLYLHCWLGLQRPCRSPMCHCKARLWLDRDVPRKLERGQGVAKSESVSKVTAAGLTTDSALRDLA